MIRCVIVEDEEIARRVLKSLLAQYCQDVMVCALQLKLQLLV